MPVISRADRGRTVNFFKGDFLPGIYFSTIYRRADDTNAFHFRLEILNTDVGNIGNDANIQLFVQTRANSSLVTNWRTIYSDSERNTIETIEKNLALNMDIFRIKLVVQNSTASIEVNGCTQMGNENGNSTVQVNLPDTILGGNETSTDWDYKLTYTTIGLNSFISKIYQFPKGSLSGDPTFITEFVYSGETVINILKYSGQLP